jgi:phage/plasmid-like protein (TIGR03299 family)
MSRETAAWLNQNVLVGFGRKAWHYSSEHQGAEPNHYDGPIPVGDVRRRLFNWEAVPVELTYSHNGIDRVATDKVGYMHSRTGDMLGIHSRKYAAHQFQDSLLNGVERICGNGLGIESAGLLSKGAIGWVSVSLPDTSTVEGTGVEYLTRLLAFGSHNGKFPTTYKLVNTLVVCDNTLALARGEGGAEYKIRHTVNSAVRVEDAHQALGLIVAGQDQFSKDIQRLIETTVTDQQWSQFVQALAPIGEDTKGKALTIAERKREELTAMYNSDERVSQWRGTAFGAFQAVNTWQHWNAIVRGADRQERNTLAQLDGSWEKFDAQTMATLHRVLQDA